MISRLLASSSLKVFKRRSHLSLASSWQRQCYKSTLSTTTHSPLWLKQEENHKPRQPVLRLDPDLQCTESLALLGTSRFLVSPLSLHNTTNIRWHSTSKNNITTTRSSSISTKPPTSSNNVENEQEEDEPTKLTKLAAERARASAKVAQKRARAGAKVAKKGALTARDMLQQYGPVFVGTYAGLYVATLAALFGGIDSGLINPVTLVQYFHWGQEEVTMESKSTVDVVVNLLESYSFTKPYAGTIARNPHTASLAVAWVATKFTEPIRLLITMGTVPRLARWLGRTPASLVEDEAKNKTNDKASEESNTQDKRN